MLDEQEVTSAFQTPHAFVPAGGGTLAYWRFGSGPDMVLVHGWPLHAATFRRIVPALAQRFTLHLFDLPGVGQSRAHGPATFPSHAAAVRSAIASLGLTRYALLAHDSGGVIARLVAEDNPDVQTLVLWDTEIPGHHPLFLRLAKLPGFEALLLASLRIGPLRRSPLSFGGAFTDATYTDGEFGHLFVRPLLASPRTAAGHLAFLRSADFSFFDALPAVHARITAPVLCVWGSDDPFFPIAKARRMLREFARTDAELVEIPGARAFPHEDHPAALVAAVLPFVQRHAQREPELVSLPS
jgi:pimeloyl-ACP methyl ester carboxylesterase